MLLGNWNKKIGSTRLGVVGSWDRPGGIILKGIEVMDFLMATEVLKGGGFTLIVMSVNVLFLFSLVPNLHPASWYIMSNQKTSLCACVANRFPPAPRAWESMFWSFHWTISKNACAYFRHMESMWMNSQVSAMNIACSHKTAFVVEKFNVPSFSLCGNYSICFCKRMHFSKRMCVRVFNFCYMNPQ